VFCLKCGAAVNGKFCCVCGTRARVPLQVFHLEVKRRRKNFTVFAERGPRIISGACWDACWEKYFTPHFTIYDEIPSHAYALLDEVERRAERLYTTLVNIY